jgi:hypothetical protein
MNFFDGMFNHQPVIRFFSKQMSTSHQSVVGTFILEQISTTHHPTEQL